MSTPCYPVMTRNLDMDRAFQERYASDNVGQLCEADQLKPRI